MYKKVNIGVVGYANIAKKAMIPAIIESSFFNLLAIATQKESQVSDLKKHYQCIIYSNYEALINDNSIQAVYIPLPNSLHFEWVKKALINNKHVLVEKSLACTIEEVEELNAIAKENSLALVESFQFRFHPQLQYIKDNIASNKIGKIRSIRSSFCFPPFTDKNNIRYKRELGGGALLDAGAYPIKLAKELLGANLKITDATLNYDTYEVDICGAGTILETNRKIPLQFVFGFDHHYQCNIEIIGSEGKISTQRIFTAPYNLEPIINIEFQNNLEQIKIEPFNAYKGILNYFYKIFNDKKARENELNDNILQARMLDSFYKISKK